MKSKTLSDLERDAQRIRTTLEEEYSWKQQHALRSVREQKFDRQKAKLERRLNAIAKQINQLRYPDWRPGSMLVNIYTGMSYLLIDWSGTNDVRVQTIKRNLELGKMEHFHVPHMFKFFHVTVEHGAAMKAEKLRREKEREERETRLKRKALNPAPPQSETSQPSQPASENAPQEVVAAEAVG